MPKKNLSKSRTSKSSTKSTLSSKNSKIESVKDAPRPKLASVWRMFGTACVVLGRHWKLFGGILLIYALLYVVLVGGISNGDLTSIKKALDQTVSGGVGTLSTGVAVFTFLMSSSTATVNSAASAYQSILALVFSVILIWALRQTYAGNVVRIRDSFYSGVYPLITFILVLFVVMVQMIPMALGAGIYTVVIGGGIAITGLEQLLFGLLAILLALVSLYLILSSVFALYIVTLPEMTPMKSLRSARELVRGRRLVVFGKILFMVVAVALISVVIVAPLAIFLTPIVTIVFFLLGIIGLAVVHSYMYGLYRELLK